MEPSAAPAFALTALLKQSTWLFPIAETIHIWGFVILAGSAILFDLRILGVARDIPVRALAWFLLPFSLGAVLVVFPSGVLLFATQPLELLANRVFMLKLTLIFLAGCNALAFHAGPYRTVEAWNVGLPAPALARGLALLSILLWLSVIACGRLLAYT